MKITEGYYRCRNNSRARVLCADAPGSYPVVGYHIVAGDDTGDFACPCEWTAEGREYDYLTQGPGDLIEPWKDESEQAEQDLFDQLTDLLCEMGQRGIHIDKEALWAQVEASEACRPKQPVRVSGWFVIKRATGVNVTHMFDTRDEAVQWQARHHSPEYTAIVYVTGVEGVGPEDDQ